MYQLFYQYLQVATLRRTPQELPGQPLACAIAVLAAFVTGMAGLLFATDFIESLWRNVLSLAVPGVLLYLLLTFRGLQHRYVQSFSALCGTAAVIYLCALPLMPFIASQTAESSGAVLAMTAVFLINIWALVVTAHILRHTLEVSFTAGLSIGFALMIITIIIVETLVPSAPASQIGQQVSGLLLRVDTAMV